MENRDLTVIALFSLRGHLIFLGCNYSLQVQLPPKRLVFVAVCHPNIAHVPMCKLSLCSPTAVKGVILARTPPRRCHYHVIYGDPGCWGVHSFCDCCAMKWATWNKQGCWLETSLCTNSCLLSRRLKKKKSTLILVTCHIYPSIRKHPVLTDWC